MSWTAVRASISVLEAIHLHHRPGGPKLSKWIGQRASLSVNKALLKLIGAQRSGASRDRLGGMPGPVTNLAVELFSGQLALCY